jgi:tight adherence protein B
MLEAAALLGFTTLAAAVAYGWRVIYLRGLVLDRLGEPRSSAEQQIRRAAATRAVVPRVGESPLSRPLRWLPWAMTLPAGLVLYFVVGMPWPYCVSLAVIAGLLGSQLEGFLAVRKAARLETQLADAVDIMVGALGAGAGVAGALEAAIEETQNPLRGQLEEVLGRIRFGDQPQAVFKNLSERIPLETFLLFASTLAVHWEVGGSLAPTLATVGRTVRDRIDISRRIRSNTAQSQISTLMMLGLTYFIALVVYSNGPEQMKEFLSTSIGSFFAAGSMLLQAVGIVWMSYISRMKF